MSRSISASRTGTGATLPWRDPHVYDRSFLMRPNAARHTFDMACALRVPTLRVCACSRQSVASSTRHESAHRRPAESSDSPDETSRTACAVRRAQKREAVPRHTPAARGDESPAGDAFTILPPKVPRFWLAIPPVQLAARASKENSRVIISCCRKSVYVQPAPIWISSSETSMRRNSGRFQMLTSFRAAQFSGGILDHEVGAAGDGQPRAGFAREKRQHGGQSARRDQFVFGGEGPHVESPACGCRDRIENLHVARAATEIARETFANIVQRRLGLGLQQLHRRQNHAWRTDAALCTAILQERVCAPRALASPRRVLQWSPRSRPALAARARGSLSRAPATQAPSTRRTRPLRILLSFPSIRAAAAARRAIAPSDGRAHSLLFSPFTVSETAPLTRRLGFRSSRAPATEPLDIASKISSGNSGTESNGHPQRVLNCIHDRRRRPVHRQRPVISRHMRRACCPTPQIRSRIGGTSAEVGMM